MGQTVGTRGVYAFFPTIRNRESAGIIRIEPDSKYTVEWDINSLRIYGQETKSSLDIMRGSFSQRTQVLVNEFLFFYPAHYIIVSNVHIWPSPPKFAGDFVDLGESFSVTASGKVYVDSSPFVIVLGAIIGGLISFLIKFFVSLQRSLFGIMYFIKLFFFDSLMAILLCSVGTILLSRLSSTESLINIVVKDFWGALTIGFIIHWFGLKYLSKIIGEPYWEDDSDKDKHSKAPEVEKTEETPVNPEASLRRGAMILCVGIGLGVGAVILRYWGDKDTPPAWPLGVVAAIVALVGVGYLLLYFLARDRMTGQAQLPSAQS